MAQKEYTKQDLLDLLKKHTINGRVSYDSFAEIVFDPKFPDSLFENAKEGLELAWNDQKRFKDLAESLAEKYNVGVKIQERIVELSYDRIKNRETISSLKDELSDLESKIAVLEKEFYEIKNRISERRGE